MGNKGLCNRDSGLCECFAGYDGHACQRASCPNDCSGHGTCHSIKDIAAMDWDNVYQLWDKDMTMGCVCDPQYTGADCSLRQCKYGIDPLYTNNYNTANLPAWTYKLGPTTGDLYGTYAIKFYDVFDEDYVTEPITYTATGADACTSIETALEALPNSIVPQGSVACSHSGAASSVYSAGQPGEYLDYFYTLCEDVKVKITRVEDRTTTSSRSTSLFHQIAYLDDLTAAESKKLKTCLGDSDGDWTNNVDVENWDYGDWSYSLAVKSATITSYTVGSNNAAAIDVENVQSVLDTNNAMVGQYPHAIKLVPVDQDDTKDGGHIYLVWYDSHMTSPRFKLLSNPPYDKVTWSTDTTVEEFYVFTTDGKAQLLQTKQFTFDGNGFDWNVNNPTDADGNDWNDVPVFAWFEAYSNIIYTSADASCESGNTNSTKFKDPSTDDSLAHVRAEDNLMDCLSKGDQIFITDGAWGDTLDNSGGSNYQF